MYRPMGIQKRTVSDTWCTPIVGIQKLCNEYGLRTDVSGAAAQQAAAVLLGSQPLLALIQYQGSSDE